MLLNEKLLFAAQKGIHYLTCSQLANGEFRCFMSNNRNMTLMLEDSTVFVTACILHAIRLFEGVSIEKLRNRAYLFLLKERDKLGAWCYWTRRSNKNIASDLDDTSCVFYEIKHLMNEIEKRKVIDLILKNQSKDGLFYTWINPKNEPNDIDCVVIANVVRFLGNCREAEPSIEYLKSHYVGSTESVKPCDSYYYLHDASLHYCIARAIIAGVDSLHTIVPEILYRIEHYQNESLIEIILNTSSYLMLSDKIPKFIDDKVELILENQQALGSWLVDAWYAGPQWPGPHSIWFGSEELMSGFALEAISLFLKKRVFQFA